MECSKRRLNFNYRYLCRTAPSSISPSNRLNSSHSSPSPPKSVSPCWLQPISTASSSRPGNIINYNHPMHHHIFKALCVLIIIAIKLMSETEALRSTILQEADTLGSRRRFGLFSSPISTAIGDDGQYKTRLRTFVEIKTPGMNRASRRPTQEASTPILRAQGSSTSHTSRASIPLHLERSRMNTSTRPGSYSRLRTKTSTRVTIRKPCSSLPPGRRSSTSLPMSSRRKTILRRTLRGTGMQRER